MPIRERDVIKEFTGEERDGETGLDFFQARYFSSPQGRFTSADEPFNDQEPNDPQSWNLYSYTRNNPLRFTDPLGQYCVDGGGNGYYDDDKGGQTCADAFASKNNNQASVTVGVGRDEANLIMLSMIGTALSEPHTYIQLASDAGRSAASVVVPGPSAVAECITPGGNCNKTNLALAAIPFGPGRLARILRKHSFLSAGKYSKFAKGLDDAAHIESMIKAALASPNRATGYADGAAYLDANLGVAIGTDPAGHATTTLRVVLDDQGNVHSAFPVAQIH